MAKHHSFVFEERCFYDYLGRPQPVPPARWARSELQLKQLHEQCEELISRFVRPLAGTSGDSIDV